MILLEGPRNSGKTYLVQNSGPDSELYYKMSFLVTQSFKFNSDAEWGFSVGKDIQLFNLRNNGFIDNSIIVDRSFISSAVYSYLLKRIDYCTMKSYISFMVENYYNSEKDLIYYIHGKNPNIRPEKDSMDYLDKDYESQLSIYDGILEDIVLNFTDIKVCIFENKFDNESVNRFKGILNEHRKFYAS